MLGLRSVPTLDPDRDALTVVNQALGGGMASRLFQEVREERGLAYSVYSYRAAFDDSGFLAVYAGTAPERVQETLDVIETELGRLVRDGLPAAELESAKGHLTGSIAMSLETSASRMRRLGRVGARGGRDPEPRRGDRAHRRPSPPTTRAGSSTGCSPTRRARWPSSVPTTRANSRPYAVAVT